MPLTVDTTLVEEHPELVEHYTAFLEAQFEAHQALAFEELKQRVPTGGR